MIATRPVRAAYALCAASCALLYPVRAGWATPHNTRDIIISPKTPEKRRQCHLTMLRATPRKIIGGVLALRAHCALLLDQVPPQEPPRTPLPTSRKIW